MQYRLDLLLLTVAFVTSELVTKEASGNNEDSDEVDDDMEEGSGQFIEDLQDLKEHKKELKVVPDSYYNNDLDIHFGKEDDYYDEDEYNEILETFDDYMYERDRTEDSVLKVTNDEIVIIERKQDIEIKPKPPGLEDDILLDTSQVLIMIGSAFISFGVVMLVFFLCHQRLGKKTEKKAMPYTIPTKLSSPTSSPIVKDYQRVPTTTQEFLAAPHIEMYRGEEKTAPLLSRTTSSGV
jgi:hypothetical protein